MRAAVFRGSLLSDHGAVAGRLERADQGRAVTGPVADDRGALDLEPGMGALHARDASECELHSLGPRARSPQAAGQVDRDELGSHVEAVLVGLAAGTECSAEPEDEQQESLHDPCKGAWDERRTARLLPGSRRGNGRDRARFDSRGARHEHPRPAVR